jgi:hypothetical protein
LSSREAALRSPSPNGPCLWPRCSGAVDRVRPVQGRSRCPAPALPGRPRHRRRVALLAIPLLTAASLTLVPATAGAAAQYGICVASITLSFTPPVTLTISWADGSTVTSTVTVTVTGLTMLGGAGGGAALTATITAGRFSGDQITIASIRDPLALLTCLTTGLSTASGITSLTFTQL